jgi:hypothetical protein
MPKVIQVELSGDCASAAYFMMAEWPDPATAPKLETSGGPLRILMPCSKEGLGFIQRILRVVGARSDALGRSAVALLREIERQAQAEDRGDGVSDTG